MRDGVGRHSVRHVRDLVIYLIFRGCGIHLIGLFLAALVTACSTAPRAAAPPTHFSGPVAPVGFPATVRSLGADRGFYLAHADETRERLRRAAGDGPVN